MTAEEHIKKLFFMKNNLKNEFDEGYCKGVRDALRIHGIYYKWLDGDAE